MAIQRLEEIGKWMKINGNAIYNTRITKDYKDGNTYFTRGKTNNVKYALVCLAENSPVPATVKWITNIPKKGTQITLLQTGEKVKWSATVNGVEVTLPKGIAKNATLPALAFAFQGE